MGVRTSSDVALPIVPDGLHEAHAKRMVLATPRDGQDPASLELKPAHFRSMLIGTSINCNDGKAATYCA
jgi:hypothetical protein